MRISDWSSDVCSSDLRKLAIDQLRGERELTRGGADMVLTQHDADNAVRLGQQACQLQDTFARYDDLVAVDRKRVVEGKSVLVSVDLGGRGSIKNKNKQSITDKKKICTELEKRS